jgi:hypothetical protein
VGRTFGSSAHTLHLKGDLAWERLCETSQASASLLASLPLLKTVVVCDDPKPTHVDQPAIGRATAGPEALVALVRSCEQACRAVTVRVLRRPHDETHKQLITELQGATQRYVTVTECEEGG